MTVEVLTHRDGKQPGTIIEKEEMPRQESFPPNNHNQYFELPPAGQAHLSVTEQTVKWAPFAELVETAPYVDKLFSEALRLLREWKKERIINLVKAVVWTDWHPAMWKRASRFVICKLGQDDYTKLQPYPSTSVLSYMGKVVKKVVAEQLAEWTERRELICDSQYGSKQMQSAIDTVAFIVNTAYAA